MSDLPFEEIVTLALQLSPVEQARLMERLAAAMQDALARDQETDEDVEPLWTDEQLAEMMKPEPMTGAEIVASGILGGWKDKGITDGAEWVNEQKRKRKERRRW